MKRLILALSAVFILLAARPGVSLAEVGEITIAQQYGMAYLQFLAMQRDHLIEKHVKAAGLRDGASCMRRGAWWRAARWPRR